MAAPTMANSVGASAFSISNCRHRPKAVTPKSVRSLSVTAGFPAWRRNNVQPNRSSDLFFAATITYRISPIPRRHPARGLGTSFLVVRSESAREGDKDGVHIG